MGNMQTIWTALTSENQLLVDIICTPLSFLEAFLYMLIFLTVLNIESSKTSRAIFVILFSSISLVNLFFIPVPYNTFINVLSMPLLVFFIFKTGILKSFFSEIVVYIVTLFLCTMAVLLYSGILGIPATATIVIPLHKLFCTLVFHAFLFLFYKLCVRFNINISLIDKFKFRNAYLLIINFIIGSIAIGIESYILWRYIDFMPKILVVASFFVILLYFGISMFSLFRTNKLELTTQILEEQKLYNKTLSTLHDNIRGFKHDFNNIIQSIGGYLSTDNVEGLKVYYNDLLEECQINNNLAVLNPELINNPAIYSLLADKYYKSEELGIKMNLEVLMDISNLNIKIFELSRILGILLDNALEAASQCDNKLINITFRKDKNHNKDLIIIQNTYANKDVKVDRIFEKGYTSKTNIIDTKNHGLGLWEVKRYLKKHTNLDLFTTTSDEYFTQQFEIYN